MDRSFTWRFGKDIKGVIMDIDGVLLDSLEIWEDLGRRYLKSRGKKAEEDLEKVLETMSLEEGAAFLSRTYLQSSSSSEVLSGLEEMLRDYYCHEVPAMRGAADFLAALRERGIRITAATLSPGDLVGKALQRNGLDFFIERIFTAGEIPEGKNSPAMYDAAASYMGLSGREICVFEDSLFAIETAAGAGYHTVWICGEKETGIEDPCRKAEICIRDLKEALPLIQAEGGS